MFLIFVESEGLTCGLNMREKLMNESDDPAKQPLTSTPDIGNSEDLKFQELIHDHTGHDHSGHDHSGHDHGLFHFGHHHDHGSMIPDQLTRAFVIGIILNSVMVLVGAAAGYWYHSLALLSDAGHNLGDVASLLMALAAIRIAKVKASDKFTYGYKKSTVLTSLINAVVLLLITTYIVYSAIIRLGHPALEVKGTVISLVAFLGILINSASAWLFLKDKENDINVKGAYMHLAADALVSAGVMIAGIVMYFTHWFWLDPVISIVISIAILAGTWSLLVQSLFLTIDGVPQGVDLEKIKTALEKIPGIQDAHHVHVWALSTTENALTAHLVMDAALTLNNADKVKATARHELQHLNIQHITLEVESSEKRCINGDC